MNLQEIDLTDLDLFAHGDPHQAWRTLRAEAPVYWHERQPGRGFWAVTKFEDALKVYHDPATYSSAHGMSIDFSYAEPGQSGFGQMMIVTDPPRHARLRRIISHRFTPRAIRAYEPEVRRIAKEIIDTVIETGRCDLVVDIAAKLPTAVICEMLGVPREHWDLMFALANMTIGAADPEYQQGRTEQETGRQAQVEVFDYFSDLIGGRRDRPADDLVSALTQGRINGVSLSDLEVLFNCFLLVIAGQETTRNATSGGMLALIEHPAERQRLRNDPSLITTAIEEILRYTSPVTHILRTAMRDTRLRGREIAEGQKVVIWNASANRDEDVFVDPDRFDITRTPNDHLGFGHGEHFCLGSHLARLEMRAMIEEINRRMPDLELDGPVERLRANLVAGIKHMPVRFTPCASGTSS